MFNLRCKVSHLNGVQTKLKCKPNVKRCKRFVFPVRSHLFHHNALKTKAITFFQADHILTRFVFPPLCRQEIWSRKLLKFEVVDDILCRQ